MPDHGVLVVDAVFAQREELRDSWDLVVWLEVGDEERVRRVAARDGVAVDDQRRYLDAQRVYRAAADPVRSADLVVDNTEPDRPVLVGRPVVPSGWHRTPHGLRRLVTTDRETAEHINRLLSGG